MLNTGDGNWWTGKLKRNKTVGLFPCNYVEFVQNSKGLRSTKETAVKTLPLDGDRDEQKISDLGIPETDYNRPDYTRPSSAYSFRKKSTSEILQDISAALNESQSSKGSSRISYHVNLPVTGDDYDDDDDDHKGSNGYEKDHYEIKNNENFDENFESRPSPQSETTLRNSFDRTRYDYDLYDDDTDTPTTPNTPPVPPPHSVSVSSMSRNNSSSGYHTPDLDRTPSPLRNAMDDVLESLDNLDSISRSNSAALCGELRLRTKSSSTTLTNVDDEDEMMPFGPDSYNRSSKRGSQVTRADTFNSISSIHTNSLSIISSSTTPTTISNMSATSAGSLARRKFFSQSFVETEIATPALAEYSFTSETPVKLPTSKSDNKSIKSLKLQKSTGFLKKLFSSSTNQLNNASMDSFGGSPLQRTKSRSSRISVSSSSSRVRNTLRSVSSKMERVTSPFKGDSPQKKFGWDSTLWVEIRRDIHRANTLTENERKQRKRNKEIEGIPVIDPLFNLKQIQGNENSQGLPASGDGKVDLKHQDFGPVDQAIQSLRTWPQLMTPSIFATSRIGRQFHYDVEQLRAIFMFCALKLGWEAPLSSGQDEDATILSRVMNVRRASPYELALCVKSMCESLDIPCQVVRGHLKVPGQVWDTPGPGPVNHFWNAVIVNGEWRFVDASLASPTFPNRDIYYKADPGRPCTFYFLAKPCHLIYTHVPADRKQQHLVPPLDDGTVLALPVAGPHAFGNHIRFIDFNTSLTRLENYEVAELKFQVPHGIELMAEVVPGSISNYNDLIEDKRILGLAQPFWTNGKRHYRVKAFLPDPYSQGRLCIYATKQGMSQSIKEDCLPIAYSLGITHKGENASFEFVTRHPTPHAKRQDLYVIQPQCKKLIGGNSYEFIIDQHPSGGLTAGAGFVSLKLGVQTPSGRIYRLRKKEGADDLYGQWSANIKCLEVGNWRGLVLADRGNAWSVFCEWYCV